MQSKAASISSRFKVKKFVSFHSSFNRVLKRNMRLVACPQCNKPCEFSPENSFRPFCSNRCKLIDLGQWANEGYKIPSNKPIDANDEDLDSNQPNN